MSFTNDNDLEIEAAGQADWDTALNANFQILERGFHIKGTAGSSVDSGQICLINSAGFIVPYDSRSTSLLWPHLMSYKSVTSGENAAFIREGIVRSMAIWSGTIVIGLPVFVSPQSIGFAVSSYPAAAYPAGLAISADAIYFAPGKFNPIPELVSEVNSSTPTLPGSQYNFSMSLCHRGIARTLRVVTDSCDAWDIRFWSGSSRVDSELLYEATGVATLSILDQAMFPLYNTDVSSPALIFGRVSVGSGSTASSASFAVTLFAERFR